MDWDRHWAEAISPALYPPHSTGLGPLSFIAEAMPRQGKILEAGCGMGHIVHELRMQGFDCEGVDNAKQTIARIREINPDLPVFAGDVLHLGAPDGHYAGYISLGVVEHREEGPEPFLREAWRVLANNGRAIFTVPFFNTVRRHKAKIGCYPPPPRKQHDLVFYQYAFMREEFTNLLEQHGFTIRAVTYYDPWKGLKDELPPFAWLNSRAKAATKGRQWADRNSWLYPLAAHMLALICEK
ncbi:MAG: class I SAM-dependent methyltransferase [Deltaproteobacteria bacterium]|jgi:SAM-dependent methyltransferase|nr:class I SAM-dependent methyltransferase [Deltaproteobacteria bacterium]